MVSITVDVVLLLPSELRADAIRTSAVLAGRMAEHGHPSAFRLGAPLATDGRPDPCEPHISLFMLRADEDEIAQVLGCAAQIARRHGPIDARGLQWRHNPVGAPELHLVKNPSWTGLQRDVVGTVEPVRRGRLRDADPAGTDLPALVDILRRRDPSGAQLHQLLTYGYDEIGERFSPHVTYAWPVDEKPSPLDGLPEAATVHGRLDTLAVYGMGTHGTCITPYGRFPLTGSRVNGVAHQQAQHVSSGVEVAGGLSLGRADRP